MLNHEGVTGIVHASHELGMVICKICNEVLYTVPTNGVKKIPGICTKEECLEKTHKSEGETV